MFFLLYKKNWWRRFWWFSEEFPPLSEDFRRFSKIVPKARRTFSNIFREFPKTPEDVRRLPKTIEEGPKMFRWHTNYSKYNLTVHCFTRKPQKVNARKYGLSKKLDSRFHRSISENFKASLSSVPWARVGNFWQSESIKSLSFWKGLRRSSRHFDRHRMLGHVVMRFF